MLSGLRPASLARLRFPLAELTQAARCARSRPRAGLPVAAKAESQDLCFLAGEGKRSFLGAPRRPGRAARRDRRPRGPRGSASTPRPSPLHRRPAPRPRRRRRPSRCYVLATDAETEHGRRSARARSSRPRRVAVRDGDPAPPGRPRRPGAAALPLAPARAAGCRRSRPGDHERARARARRARLRRRAGPDRVPALRRPGRRPGDDRLSGRTGAYLDWRPMTSDEIRETFLSFFEERGHLRVPSSSLVPAARGHLDPAHGRRDAAVQALLRGPRGAAGAARLRRASAAFAPPTSRRSATRGAT